MRDLSIERPPSATTVVDHLALGEARLTGRQLATIVGRIRRQDPWWRPLVRYDFDHRWYVRLHWSRSVEVWLLGWQPGQDTQFHDHGGSSGAFVVTEGTLNERYGSVERWDGGQGRDHRPGRACWFGPDYAHNLGNGGTEVATSIHAYSPPLSTMTYYRSETSPRSSAQSLVPYDALFTSGPEPGIDLDLATSAVGHAAPAEEAVLPSGAPAPA